MLPSLLAPSPSRPLPPTRLGVEHLEERQVPSTFQVSDIFPGSGSGTINEIGPFTSVNGVLFFRANDGSNGFELWRSDGTSSGTSLVRDIRPGSGTSNPSGLTNLNGVLYFSANDGSNGYELWRSDGTSSGTTLVRDIRPGSGTSNPSELTNLNGVLYFAANDGSNGFELWRSDGTSSGSTLVRDIRPGSDGSFPSLLTNVGGVLYFRADDGSVGYELWRSDGTSSGTTLVRDIDTSGSSDLAGLTNVGGVLYFRADDGSVGYELWQSNGTSSGTTLVRDIRPGSGSSFPSELTNQGGVLYFRANDGSAGYELWRSDGTSSGTTLVRDINTSGSSYLIGLRNVGGILYFGANDGSAGNELWRSDGTSSGTILVRDINPGNGSSNPYSLTNVSGVLYFSANDGSAGNELWRSDGTSSGTTLVRDINPGGSSYPSRLTNVDGVLFFRANDGSTGAELWANDDALGPVTLTPVDDRTAVVGGSISVTVVGTSPNGRTIIYSLVDPPTGASIDPATGVLSFTPTVAGTFTLTVRASESIGPVPKSATDTFTVSVISNPVDQTEFPEYVLSGGVPLTVRNPDGSPAGTVVPDAGMGARAVVADLTGDRVADTIAVTGPGTRVRVTVTDGATGAPVRSFTAFEDSFTDSAVLAAGDVNGDGIADIAVGPDGFGGPRVTVFDGATGAVLADFFGIDDPDFRGGVRVALGDFNRDGLADLAVAAGVGGGPRVALFDGASLRPGVIPTRLVADFFAFEQTLRDGANVALGDVDGDGKADLILSGGPGGGPRVLVWDAADFLATNGSTQTFLANFFAADPSLTGGARVAAKDLDGDAFADLVVAVPTGPAASVVRAYLGKDLTPSGTPPAFDDFDVDAGGVFVG